MAMTTANDAHRWFSQSRGFTLLEVVVVLAVASVLVPAVFTAISATAEVTDHSYDRSILFELAQSQFEDVQRQAFQTSPASYSLLSMPAGYSVVVTTTPAVTYTYPPPSSTNTAETVQNVTVNVTGVSGNFTLSGYKVR
ncbi:MAG: prepilin-type N-terminal cleavage/methylation domain-containing protein [Chloroflexi bacterium]|nr:prepilin-type N-terminal cleavage/methylation domain-containing protein [Chloroflexota bacterium]